MRLVGHMLDYILDYMLDHLIIGLVTMMLHIHVLFNLIENKESDSLCLNQLW